MAGEIKTDAISSRVEALGYALPPHEHYFGNKEYYDVEDPNSLIILPQIRDGLRVPPVELKHSIMETGLDNPPNIALVNDQELDAYLGFVNKTWGSNIQFADLEPMRQPNGLFNLVVAGHQRTLCIQEGARDYFSIKGVWPEWPVQTKVLKDNSVASILAKQYHENLHSNPKKEREAMAIVELYYFGFGTTWTSPEEFLSAPESKDLGRKILYDALAFASLPREVFMNVFAGNLKYEIGIALGKAYPIVRDCLASEIGSRAEDELGEDIEAAIRDRMIHMSAHMMNNNHSILTARKWISAQVKAMERAILARRPQEADEELARGADVPMFSMVSAVDQERNIRRREARQRDRELEILGRMPIHRSSRALSLFAGDQREAEAERQVLQDTIQAQQELARAIGYQGLHIVRTQTAEGAEASLLDVAQQ